MNREQWLLLCAHAAVSAETSTVEERRTFLIVAARVRFDIEEISKKVGIGDLPKPAQS